MGSSKGNQRVANYPCNDAGSKGNEKKKRSLTADRLNEEMVGLKGKDKVVQIVRELKKQDEMLRQGRVIRT